MSPQLRASQPRRRWWFTYGSTRTGLAYWITYILTEPRDAAHAMPGRLPRRLLGQHGHTCDGRPDHQRRRQTA